MTQGDILTETLTAMPKLPVPMELPKIPGANMIQFPALLPGMPVPPAIPALPGMEKVPPPPGVKIVDATGKVVIAGPDISKILPKPPELPGLPGLPEVTPPKEKLGEEEVEKLLEKEYEPMEEMLEETEGRVFIPEGEFSAEELVL